jgi:hypothetical protein
MQTNKINCQDCRHEEDKTRPRNMCLVCVHKSNFELKGESDFTKELKQPRDTKNE